MGVSYFGGVGSGQKPWHIFLMPEFLNGRNLLTVPVLDAFESSLSVALNSPRILRVRDEAADGRPMGDEKAETFFLELIRSDLNRRRTMRRTPHTPPGCPCVWLGPDEDF